MTTNRKLVELFRAISAHDIDSATEIASQLSKLEERKGHRIAARALRGALASNGKAHPRVDQMLARHPELDTASLISTALVRLDTHRQFSDIVLDSGVRSELDSIVREWKHSSRLKKVGLSPRSKLLFHGPPGCGKSLTAQALANALKLPIYMVRFDAVIGAFLGQTAIHLRQLFRFAETTPCVLLLDELDALGKRRGNPLDVGELDRIVISMLQELEHSKPLGLVVGTTNLAKHLDDALWRRFDLSIYFKPPSRATLREFAIQIARRRAFNLPQSALRRVANSKSFSDAERVIFNEIRREALRTVID